MIPLTDISNVLQENELHDEPGSCAAPGAAVGAENSPLTTVIDRWPTLSRDVQEQILELVVPTSPRLGRW